jgi:hypothetical protein
LFEKNKSGLDKIMKVLGFLKRNINGKVEKAA